MRVMADAPTRLRTRRGANQQLPADSSTYHYLPRAASDGEKNHHKSANPLQRFAFDKLSNPKNRNQHQKRHSVSGDALLDRFHE